MARHGRRRNLHLARFADFEFLRPCPPADLLWVRDYLDSKAGFRRFFDSIGSEVCGVRIPEGAVCENPAEAARLLGVEQPKQG